jgi:uncharacterized protein YcbX
VEGHVVRISTAPVKALALCHPDEVELGSRGVAGDRRFLMYTADARLVSDKTHPRLMHVRAEWDETTRRLALRFPDGEGVEGVVEPGEPVEMVLHRQPHACRAVPGPWQEALSRYVGEPLTLLWSETGAADRVARGGGVTILSRGSLERLREEAGVEQPVDGRRFRMLLEIDGVGEHEEDGWIGRDLRVGTAVVRPRGDVGRCVITTMNPDTAVSDLDTLKVLAGYRREGVVEPLPFGIYGEVVHPGRVRVGDPVGLV